MRKIAVRGWLFFILTLGLLLRIIRIQSREIQYDDAFSYFLSTHSLAEIVRGTAADTMPPLYYFLLHYWILLSEEIWVMRLLSVILSMTVIVIAYLLFERIMGEKTALAAAGLTAISPFQIYHAQDLRMYALMETGQILAIYFFLKWREKKFGFGNFTSWAGLLLGGAISLYSHSLGVVGLMGMNIYLLGKREWKALRNLVLIQSGMIVLFIPWLVYLPGQVSKVQAAFWTQKPGIVDLLQALMMFTTGLPLKGIWLGLSLLFSIYLLILLFIEIIKNRPLPEEIQLVLAFLVTPILVLFFLSYVVRSVFVPRIFLLSSVFFYGLVAYLLTRRWERPAGKIVLACCIFAALIGLPAFYSFEEFPRSSFREAANYLSTRSSSKVHIIHDNKLSYFPVRYYWDGEMFFLADAPDSFNDTYAPTTQQVMNFYPSSSIAAASKGAEQIFFVTFTKAIEEYASTGDSHPVVDWLKSQYHEGEITIFGDLEIHVFEK